MTETDRSGPDVIDRVAAQRHTLNALRVGVVPGQAAVAGSVAVLSLLAKSMLGSDRLAGLAAASFTLGSAFFSVPLAAYMRRHGRRPGLSIGLLVGGGGALVASGGGQLDLFWMLLVGMFVFGAGQAANNQARYAAADLAPERDRAQAIGAVVWLGTLGAAVGPVLTPRENRFMQGLGVRADVGPLIFASALMAIGALAYFALLRPDPLVLAGGVDPHAERRRPLRQLGESYRVIATSSKASLGIAAMAISQGVMAGVMTMTAPHMKDHNQQDLSALVIAVHIVGMYGLAPLVGRFVDRVGAVRSVQFGAGVIGIGCITAAVAGYVPALIFIGLFLVGLGWNVGLIAGTTLLTSNVPLDVRVEAQGTGDLTLSLCGATAAVLSGLIKHGWGFHALTNLAATLAAVLLMLAVFTQAGLRRRDA